MPQFAIEPKFGVGPIKLGMTRQEVHDAIASYRGNQLDQASHPSLDYAFGNSLQIEYSPDGFAQFIGIGYYTGCGCDYMLGERHIGDFSAAELFAVLAELDGDSTQQYNPDEYDFRNVRMTVWEADTQYDYRHGETRPVYGQVGVASSLYEADN